MNIGISYWGFCESFDASKEAKTPDGHRYGRPLLIDALNSAKHKVYSLQERRENVPYSGLEYSSEFPEIDVLFIEWRWPTYKNSGKNKFENDLDRQSELLEHYHGKIPIVIWDCDYKLSAEDEEKWPLAIIADPAFNPRLLTRKRQRLMFWTDWTRILQPTPSSSAFEYGYIGNNYERPQAFESYYSLPAKNLRESGVQTTVHGNWLETSPERENPSELIKRHPHISFAPRLNFYDSMKRLNSFICTTHITKPEYAQRGFASPRYLENMAASVPALVPSEFLMKDILGKEWVVSCAEDVIKKVSLIREMSNNDRNAILQQQKENLMSQGVFSVYDVVNFFESLM